MKRVWFHGIDPRNHGELRSNRRPDADATASVSVDRACLRHTAVTDKSASCRRSRRSQMAILPTLHPLDPGASDKDDDSQVTAVRPRACPVSQAKRSGVRVRTPIEQLSDYLSSMITVC